MNIDTVVRFRTHAKINLFLRVLGKRTDGYHEVETILHGVSLFDEIEIAPSGDIQVAMDFAAGVEGMLPSDEENLVRRAAELLRDGRDDRGARVMVSGDTGPTHIAAAVGTPIVGIYGPTRPGRNGPWLPDDVTVSRADVCECHHLRQCRRQTMCLLDIGVDEVVAAVERRLMAGTPRA